MKVEPLRRTEDSTNHIKELILHFYPNFPKPKMINMINEIYKKIAEEEVKRKNAYKCDYDKIYGNNKFRYSQDVAIVQQVVDNFRKEYK